MYISIYLTLFILQYWNYIDSDNEDFEKDAFRPVVLKNKRCRKPTYKLQ